eukprot:TRINITY_DN2198_c0_g2_i3.p1 TRINITY_DN2198_c0_g2~~TRINITY_DN2198_c0_g2_i3.p1  ORF type:complete len:699 (+),score=100.85 TRINITY_DN2198_c0_g2_i3:90-2099(+)
MLHTGVQQSLRQIKFIKPQSKGGFLNTLPAPTHFHKSFSHPKRAIQFSKLTIKCQKSPSSPATEQQQLESSSAGDSGVKSGIRLEKITKTFKNQIVLKDVSWEVTQGERVGLVGINGAGKTTQLQIITGALEADSGEIIKSKPLLRMAYLNQEFDVVKCRTVREELASVYQEQLKLVDRQEQIQNELEQVGEDMDRMTELLDELDKLNSKAINLDLGTLDAKIDRMMPELGFSPEDNDRLVESYSGGWQMRMCLGKILLQEPDLLLLDEPTNHLDLDAIEWLEKYLKKQDIPIVIVSHDREFLDQLCTKIVETDRGVATTYKGNYTQYLIQKEERVAQQWAAWESQQKEIKKLTEMIQRLQGGAQSGRATQAEKELARLKSPQNLVEKPFVSKRREFRFPPVEKMGKQAVVVEKLTHGYSDRQLLDNTSFELLKGERVAIIGPNGCGKSTLLRLIMGQEKPIKGQARIGDHHILPNYFEQNQAEALDLELTVIGTLEQAAPDAKSSDIKSLLGRMMFSGPAMEKKVKVLSGGEKARLALAKFMLTKGTLLVLDEPTNHLDIPSKEMLEEAIKSFEGSVIAVSHDRYFLRKIATRILQVENGKLVDYEGDYQYFLEKNDQEAEKMAVKEEKAKRIEQANIKSKSKMSKAEKARLKKEKGRAFNQQAAKKK